jgi:hypothetical protein
MEHGLCGRRAGMGHPQNHITQLVNDESAAQTILDKVKSGERAANVVLCNEGFKEMDAEARSISCFYRP